MELKKRVDFLKKTNLFYGIKTLLILSGWGSTIVHIFTRDYISLAISCVSFFLAFPEAILNIAREVNKNTEKIEQLKIMQKEAKLKKHTWN